MPECIGFCDNESVGCYLVRLKLCVFLVIASCSSQKLESFNQDFFKCLICALEDVCELKDFG